MKNNKNWGMLSNKGRKAFRVFAVVTLFVSMLLSLTVLPTVFGLPMSPATATGL